MGWIINERLMPILGQINERIQNNFRTDYGKNVSDRLMCSPLERALDTLSSPKSSLVLKKDAASRVTDILNHYPENSEQILKQLTLNLLESRDNNSRICSASVLKQFSVKVVDMVPLKWDYLEIEVCDAGSSILIGDRLGVLSFVATFEQLQSRMIQLSEKSEVFFLYIAYMLIQNVDVGFRYGVVSFLIKLPDFVRLTVDLAKPTKFDCL